MTVNLYQVGGKGSLYVDPPIISKRDPTITDKIHPNGQVHPFNQMWINKVVMPVIVWKYYGKLSNGDALWIKCNTGSSGSVLTIETDDGAPFVVPDVNGNTQFFSGPGMTIKGNGPGNTVTARNTAITSEFIVDQDGINGTHTTIGAAFADTVTGDSVEIREGTYTEDLIPPAGINVWAQPGSAGNGTVNIIGKMTVTATGATNFSNIRFTTNPLSPDVILDFGGAGVIQNGFIHCSFFLSDGDMLTCNNSTANPSFNNCSFHQTGNNFDYFNITSCNITNFSNCRFFISATFGRSDIDSGIVRFINCELAQPLTCSGSASYTFHRCTGGGNNTIFLTTSGTGTSTIRGLSLNTGTAVAFSIGAGTTVNAQQLSIKSTHVNPIDGLGTISHDGVDFLDSGKTITTTTQNPGTLVTGGVSFDSGITILSALPVPETLGGTAQTTYATGDILFASGANTLTKLPVGANGQVLTLVAGLPAWV